MTPRSVLRYETWTLQPDCEPDAEPVLYAMQCAVDGETSPTSEDFAEPQDWVLRHCGQNPSHHTYREIITRPQGRAIDPTNLTRTFTMLLRKAGLRRIRPRPPPLDRHLAPGAGG